jgi:Zn-dependent M32 family carboxypeptidase
VGSSIQGIEKVSEKKDAYEILLDKYQGRYPEANREDVTKKINSVCTKFRNKIKIIDNSERKWRRFKLSFAFTQKAKAMDTPALILSELQLVIAQLG